MTMNYFISSFFFQLDINGDPIFCDANMVAGRAFLGFATYVHGPINFEELNSKLEAADGASVDLLFSELVSADSDSAYSKAKVDRRALPFAKLLNITSELIHLDNLSVFNRKLNHAFVYSFFYEKERIYNKSRVLLF